MTQEAPGVSDGSETLSIPTDNGGETYINHDMDTPAHVKLQRKNPPKPKVKASDDGSAVNKPKRGRPPKPKVILEKGGKFPEAFNGKTTYADADTTKSKKNDFNLPSDLQEELNQHKKMEKENNDKSDDISADENFDDNQELDGEDEDGAQDNSEEISDDGTTVPEKEFDESILARARKIGMTHEDAKNFSSEEDLGMFIARYEKPDEIPGQPPAGQEPDANTEQQLTEDDLKIDFDLSTDDDLDIMFEPVLVEKFKGFGEKVNKVIGQLASQNKALQASLDGMVAKQSIQHFDSLIANRPNQDDGLGDIIGTGSFEGLDPNGVQNKNRWNLHDEMFAFQEIYSRNGKTIPSQQELFNKAVNSLYGDKLAKVQEKKTVKTIRKRGRQSIARASGNNGKALTGDKLVKQINDNFDDEFLNN